MRSALIALLLLATPAAAETKLESYPIETIVKNAEKHARLKNTSGVWANVGRFYALWFEGESTLDSHAGAKEPNNAKGVDPSLRIQPLKGGVAERRTRAIEAYRRSVELENTNAQSWLALGWLYRAGDEPDDKLALQAYKKVDRLLVTPKDARENELLSKALDALEQLQENDPKALAEIAKRRGVLKKK